MNVQPWRATLTLAEGGEGAASRLALDRPSLRLPPEPMPFVDRRRPLKRWCYIGIYGADLMLCAGAARVAGVPQSFWAVWDRTAGELSGETMLVRTSRVAVTPTQVRVRSGEARLELALTPVGQPIEVVSPHGASYIWTRKTPARAHGHFANGMEARPVTGFGIIDESAGYHARRTSWEWSAGVGATLDGEPVVWNLVRGIHDADSKSERTAWVAGVPTELPPTCFSADLDEAWGADGSVLTFSSEAVRRRVDNFGLIRSDYVQPFGRFSGSLPGGIELADGSAFGVMERHQAFW